MSTQIDIKEVNKLICTHCGKEFKTKYTLRTHEKTNKACLRLRSGLDDMKNIVRKYACSDCGYETTHKGPILTSHKCREEFLKMTLKEHLFWQ